MSEQLKEINEKLDTILEILNTPNDDNITFSDVNDKIVNTAQVCKIIKRSPDRVYQLVKEGKLKKINKEGHLLFKVKDVMEYLHGK